MRLAVYFRATGTRSAAWLSSTSLNTSLAGCFVTTLNSISKLAIPVTHLSEMHLSLLTVPTVSFMSPEHPPRKGLTLDRCSTPSKARDTVGEPRSQYAL